uniref:Mannosyl-glycoprotein endo-beta-N-acetylglucosaminidase n=1 Tax=Opuntia streptacantha TaxID=393608 RepID=A0A7C8Z9E8_OPUST
MADGYLDDKWVQGDTNVDGYTIWHWYLMDVFVYFSHNLVTLPPPCWVNAAHKHGVKVLGSFITEWDEGKTICDKLLSTKSLLIHVLSGCLSLLLLWDLMAGCKNSPGILNMKRK